LYYYSLWYRHSLSTVESGLQSALKRHTARPFTESDDTRGCNNTICPPEDEQGTARNMLRIIMSHIYRYRIKELCIKLVNLKKSLYYDARSEKHQILYLRSLISVSK